MNTMLFQAILLLSFVYSETTKPLVMCKETSCIIEFELEAGLKHSVEVHEETENLFLGKSVIVEGDRRTLASDVPVTHRRYLSKRGDDNLATVALSKHSNELEYGIFSTKTHGVIEFKNGETGNLRVDGGLNRRRLDSSSVKDIVLENPEGTPWKQTKPADGGWGAAGDPPYGTVTKFYPGCYEADSVTHIFEFSVAVDITVQESLAGSAVNGNADKRNRVVTELTHMLSYAQLLYLNQLNVRLKLREVIIGTYTDPVPLSHDSNTCVQALKGFDEMQKWNAQANPQNPTGYTLLVTNCYRDITGVSYIGSICGSTSNAGVARFDPLISAHEMGHGFGSPHSFEYGVGTTGGIMDYGDGLYNGVAQFHPLKRDEMCPFLNYIANYNCNFFYTGGVSSSCGDLVLSKNEQCECLDGSTSCAGCINCVPTVGTECSAETFVLRNPEMKEVVIVQSKLLADSTCCIKKKLAKPKTLCGDGSLNVCGLYGQCTDVCSNLLGWGTTNCGFNTNGCVLNCLPPGRDCKNNPPIIYNEGGHKYIVGSIPDGSSCYLSTGRIGVCSTVEAVSTCLEKGGSTQAPVIAELPPVTKTPTPAPVIVTTVFPTKKPSKSPIRSKAPSTYPTKRPKRTRAPVSSEAAMLTAHPSTSPSLAPSTAPSLEVSSTASPSVNCGKFPRKKCSPNKGCSWCNGKCKAQASCLE